MALMYIAEYAELARDEDGNVIQAGKEPALARQFITFTGTAGASAAFNNSTNFVRIYCDTAGFLAFGLTPTAVTAQDTPVAATTAEYFGVIPGHQVSAVA
jgi:hypothetical protein